MRSLQTPLLVFSLLWLGSASLLMLPGCDSRNSGGGRKQAIPELREDGGPLVRGRPGLPLPPVSNGLKFPLKSPRPGTMLANLAFVNLSFVQPLYLTFPPDGTDRIFVVEQPGRIWVFPNQEKTTAKSLFLSIPVNNADNEEGLLGLAFDPNYKTNGYFYVNYTARAGTQRVTRVSRFSVSATNPNLADPSSERVLLTVNQPYSNHNGGMVEFGPDGKLYVGFGDGGSGGDPRGHGQNLGTLLGTILRIDPHGGTGTAGYGIPEHNPFVKTPGARGEIWAYGLRNPWRFSFDRNNGTLWAGDVGQVTREEVDIVVKGGNYGWRWWEGNTWYRGVQPPPGLNDIKPVLDYSRTVGRSITGGYVYRGSKVPELRGAYLYADYATARVFALTMKNGKVATNVQVATLASVTSFGEDQAGEVYLVTRGGRIYRLRPKTPGGEPPFPKKLSETGLFVDTAKLVASDRLLPYSVAWGHWADDGLVQRWIVLPLVGRIGYSSQGSWTFPLGTVLVQHFELPTTAGVLGTAVRLETRVLVLEEEGWAGYVYRWNDQESDAFLLPGPDSRELVIRDPKAPGGSRKQVWQFPGRANCLECHAAGVGAATVLGVNTRQLNHRRRYARPRVVANQLDVWNALGMFTQIIGPASQQPAYVPSNRIFHDLRDRVRTYLAVNCAHCHRPSGPASAGIDLRYGTPLAQTGMINGIPQHGSLGLKNPKIVSPGVKASSVLWERLRRLDGERMPPLGTHRLDRLAVEMVGQWIDGLK